MSEFVDVYKHGVIDDIEETKRVVREIDVKDHFRSPDGEKHIEKMKMLATICEAAVVRGVKDEKWFGENAVINATAQFDEKINHSDLALQFKDQKNNKQFYYVDVSIAKNLDKKFDRIKDEIDAGEMPHLKYFKSADGSFKGKVHAPRLVIGFDSQRLGNIITNWDGESENPLKDPLLKETLIEEIRMQLLAFEAYARSVGKNKIADAYAENLRSFDEALGHALPQSTHEMRSADRVYRSIEENLNQFRVVHH